MKPNPLLGSHHVDHLRISLSESMIHPSVDSVLPKMQVQNARERWQDVPQLHDQK
jgi:hypothetical protein